uniref:Calcineurin-like phosphoesterase domain-containing protein n=1 Tax=Panagrolaimus sp. PS1159 TaxID=55785 RepID=A0AC35FUZ5_9BILA
MQSSQTIDTLKNRLPLMQNLDGSGGTNRISPMEVQQHDHSPEGDPRKCSRIANIKQKVYSGHIYYCLVVMLIISTIFNLFFKLFRTIKFEFLARIFEFLFFESLLAILSFLAYKRTSLIHFNSLSLAKSRLLHRILQIFMVLIIFATHFSPIFSVVPLPDDELVTTTCYLAFGFWIHYGAFLFLLILVECFSTIVLWLKTKWSWKALHSIVPVIRQPLFTSENMHTVVALLLAIFFTLEGLYSTSVKPTIKNLHIKINNLPPEFEDFRIAMVSDIHAGPSVGKQRVFEIVETVNSLNPDAIAIVGDFVDGYIKNMANRIEPLKNLKAKYGVYGALGNHEYFFESVDNWVKYFSEELNIKMLVNDAVIFKKDGEELCFVGTDDYFADTVNIEGTKIY